MEEWEMRRSEWRSGRGEEWMESGRGGGVGWVEERADESVVRSERRREPVRQPNLEPLEHTI